MLKPELNGIGTYYVEPPKLEGQPVKIPPLPARERQQKEQNRLILEQKKLASDPFYRALSSILLDQAGRCFRLELPGNDSLWYRLLQEIAIRSMEIADR